jgi:hypothetical protein
MMPVHNKRLTSIVGIYEIVCHQRAFEIPIYWGRRAREARKRGEAAVVLEYGQEDFERGLYYITTLCYERSIQKVNSLDIQLRGR